MDDGLGATKHMITHKVTFDIYEVVVARNVCLDGDRIIEPINVKLIVVEILARRKIKQNCINYALHIPNLQPNLIMGRNYCQVV